MQRRFSVVQDRAGNVLSGASITVYASGGGLATIYSDNGVTPTGNPITANPNGEYSYYAASGTYSETITATGYAGDTQSGIVLFDPQERIGSVKDASFGAKGDGTSDDTSAFAKAGLSAARLLVPPGTYRITSTTDLGNCELEFAEGAILNISASAVVVLRKQPIAGNYQIFSTTGVVISAGARNPCWWGAVSSTSSPGATTAATNTLAFRKAAMSFYSEYVLNAGTLAAPGTYQIPYEVLVPAGLFYLSNGFAAPVGVRVRGAGGAASCLCRLTANADTDTAIPLLTCGQSLAAAPGLAYQNDPGTGQSSSVFTSAGYAETAAMAKDLYFVDQNATTGAFCPRYPGAQFSDLFFTSCGIAINFNNCADITASNIVCDMGLTGLALSSCQNIRLTGVVLYDQSSQAVSIGASVYDCSIEAQIEYPQAIGINVGGGGGVQNLKFPNLSITQNASTGTNVINVNASNVDIEFDGITVRNLGACAAVSVAGGLTNTVLRFKGYTFDGLKTNSAYNQNSNMQAFSVSSGTIYLENGVMRNLGVRSVFAGTAAIVVRGLTYSNMATAASVFDLSGCTGGDAEFFDVKGDGTTPLLTNALGSATVRVKGSSDWLGAPFVDGAFYSWNVPLPAAGQLLATVTADTDGTANLRKSAAVLYEVSIEALPALTQTITAATLLASAAANTHPQAAPTLVFSGGGTTQSVSGVTPAAGKLRVPNTYSNASANVEYLG